MSQAEVAVIPSGWSRVPAKRVFREVTELSEDGSELLLCVSEYYGVAPRAEKVDPSEHLTRAESLEGYKKCQPGDLVMNIMLAWKRALGISNYDGIVSPAYAVFRCDRATLLPRFAHYLLRDDAYVSKFKRLSTGVVDSRLRLYPEVFLAIQLTFPPVTEQERIADFLDEQTARIDALIAQKEQLLEKLAEYAAAHANEIFRERLRARGAIRLKYRCPDVTVGIVVTPAKYYVDTGVPCLRSLNVGLGYLVAENLVYISSEANELHAKSKIFAGDVVVVRSGKTGSAAVVTQEFDGANCIDLVIIRASSRVLPEWLRVYLNSAPALEQVTDASEGAIQQHFNVSSARELRIPDCPPEEQERDLAEVLRVERTTNDLRSHVQQHIERLREYRSSLISAAVSGQLDSRETSTWDGQRLAA